MRIRTLLNKFEHLKSFVYKKEYIEENGGQERLIIEIVPRKNSQAICSVCGEKPVEMFQAVGKRKLSKH